MNVDEMNLEQFARVLGLTEFFAPRRPEVLARLRIEPTQFDAASVRHTADLAAATKADDVETLRRFGGAYAGAMTECREGRTTLESLGPNPAPGSAPLFAPTDETAMMPPTEELRRLIREAEPRVAIASAAEPRDASAAPAPRAAPLREEAGGDTAMMPPTDEIRRLIKEAEPAHAMASAKASPASIPTLSLDQYAVIRATTRLRPDEADAAWSRYGVSPSERTAVEAALLRQISASPEAARQFTARLEHFVGYLASSSPGVQPPGRRDR